jgi:hypothetical protein
MAENNIERIFHEFPQLQYFFVTCPNCKTSYEVEVNVKLEKALSAISQRRLKKLKSEYCEFDGIGYALKKEYWKLVLKEPTLKWWMHGENGCAYLKPLLRPIPEEKSKLPEPFWDANFLALGNFQTLEDTVKPDKIKLLYVVENDEEAKFIIRARTKIEK